MKISVIVPFLDEEVALPATMKHLAAACASGSEVEVIAVDGGSRDRSCAVLARHRHVRILAAPRGRAAQMNAGACAATGDVLLFLHADTWLPEDALTEIAMAAARPGFVYGGFRQRFSGSDKRLAMISSLHNFRCQHAQTFYGDQAMFVSRPVFHALGGFPAGMAEDVALSQRLRAIAAPAFLATTVVTSARKFEQMGVWRSFGRVLAILVCLRLGWKLPGAFFTDVR